MPKWPFAKWLFYLYSASSRPPNRPYPFGSSCTGSFLTELAVPDLMATILEKFGMPFDNEYMSNIGRPIRIAEGHRLNFLG
jgi:hypothetical protein